MSLAATTSAALTLIDAASLKTNAATSDVKSFPLSTPSTAATWSADNSALYIASSRTIHALSPDSAKSRLLFTGPLDAPVAPVLAARDAGTLAFAQDKTVHLLSVSSRSPKVTASLPPHAAPIAHFALSADGTLLASASTAGILHVYNLAHNSNAVLRSFPAAARAHCICAFDPHVRTRLFVGAGATLAIYDTTRAASPPKTVPLIEKGVSPATGDIGHVVAISSSPYSKTLVAIACSAFVGLVDLEKEKPLFRSVPIKAPVTCMTFTADGTAIAMGTENGNILVQNLRSLDAPARIFEISKGDRVVALSLQRRVKNASPSRTSDTTAPRPPTSNSVPPRKQDLNSAKSPLRRGIASLKPPAVRTSGVLPRKSTLSPLRRTPSEDPGDISVQLETLIGGGGAGTKENSQPRLPAAALNAGSIPPPERPSSRLTAATRSASRTSSRTDASARTRTSSRSSLRDRGVVSAAPVEKFSQTSSAAAAASSTLSTAAPSAISDANPTPVRTHPSSDLSSSPPSQRSVIRAASPRPPLPELLSHNEMATLAKRGSPGVMALDTPELDRWIGATGRGAKGDKDKDKRVTWTDEESDKENVFQEEEAAEDDEGDATVAASSKVQAVLSPVVGGDIISPVRWRHASPAAAGGTLDLSPRRGNAASAAAGGPQELLRTMLDDMLFEVRQETREAIKGLHLDMLRMGRSVKSEVRTVMLEQMALLQAENARLRADNERLRMGF